MSNIIKDNYLQQFYFKDYVWQKKYWKGCIDSFHPPMQVNATYINDPGFTSGWVIKLNNGYIWDNNLYNTYNAACISLALKTDGKLREYYIGLINE